MAVTARPPARRLRPTAAFLRRRPSAWWLLALLGLHVAVCLLSQPGSRPVNDEAALLAAAERLLDGGYAVRGTTDDVSWLWHGPGVPIALAPLVALGLPLEMVRVLVGPLLLFAAVVVVHRALLRAVTPGVALAGALALGLFAPAMQPLRTVHKEPLAMLLVALAVLFALRALQAARWSWPDVGAAGLALGALVMVRVEYGWVLLGLLLVACLLVRGRPVARRCVAVLAVALACCLPWLAYTADVSGRFPYWGNSGGESLFWMSPTAIPGQTGEFNGVRPVFERASLAPARPLFRRLDRLAPLERDLELQRVAVANVRARPGAWARNLAANAVRLWFLVPTRPAPPTGAVVMYVIFNTALLLACGWAAVTLWRRRRALPAAVVALAAFAAAGVGIHLLPSADPRMTLPLVPVLVWLVAVARPSGPAPPPRAARP